MVMTVPVPPEVICSGRPLPGSSRENVPIGHPLVVPPAGSVVVVVDDVVVDIDVAGAADPPPAVVVVVVDDVEPPQAAINRVVPIMRNRTERWRWRRVEGMRTSLGT